MMEPQTSRLQNLHRTNNWLSFVSKLQAKRKEVEGNLWEKKNKKQKKLKKPITHVCISLRSWFEQISTKEGRAKGGRIGGWEAGGEGGDKREEEEERKKRKLNSSRKIRRRPYLRND